MKLLGHCYFVVLFGLILAAAVVNVHGFPPPGGVNTANVALPIPEKIFVTLNPGASPSPTITVEYQRNNQNYHTVSWALPASVHLAAQPALKYEYPYISMFYNFILAEPVFDAHNTTGPSFLYDSAQQSVLTVEDQIDLNTEFTTYPVRAYVILGASQMGLSSGELVHTGVMVYTDDVINYIVPYIYAQ